MNTTLDVWTGICQKLFLRQGANTGSIHPIHPCIIDGKQSYVYSPNLEKDDPKYFAKLKAFAKKRHIQLKADQRVNGESRQNCRRRKLLPIIFLTLGLNTEGVLAEGQTTLTSLNFINADSHPHLEAPSELTPETPNVWELSSNKEESRAIARILMDHYVQQENDPDTIRDDLENLARYYSAYPEVVSLIHSIAGEDWELKFSPHTFQTNVTGSRLSVEKAIVYFDPRSGAKLKFYNKCVDKKPFCVASPADALLHEFLHVQTILNDVSSFIAQGGLNSPIYPYEHEHQTILKENVLYKAMTALDRKHRPIRNEHSGRHVLVSCVTCIE